MRAIAQHFWAQGLNNGEWSSQTPKIERLCQLMSLYLQTNNILAKWNCVGIWCLLIYKQRVSLRQGSCTKRQQCRWLGRVYEGSRKFPAVGRGCVQQQIGTATAPAVAVPTCCCTHRVDARNGFPLCRRLKWTSFVKFYIIYCWLIVS